MLDRIQITEEQMKRASEFIELTGDYEADKVLILELEMTRQLVRMKKSNEITSLTLSQSWLYKWQVQFNARSLMNFLELRRAKSAHFLIREVAEAMYEAVPNEMKYLFNGVDNES